MIIGSNQYFMLIVTDHSRWMWVNVLRTKDQALMAFTKFKVLVENMRGCRIKILHSDCGGEFLSTDFTMLCEDAGIERHYTAPIYSTENWGGGAKESICDVHGLVPAQEHECVWKIIGGGGEAHRVSPQSTTDKGDGQPYSV